MIVGGRRAGMPRITSKATGIQLKKLDRGGSGRAKVEEGEKKKEEKGLRMED